MNIFKPRDFEDVIDRFHGTIYSVEHFAREVAKVATAKIEHMLAEAPVVFMRKMDGDWRVDNETCLDTHRAKLVQIEEIK